MTLQEPWQKWSVIVGQGLIVAVFAFSLVRWWDRYHGKYCRVFVGHGLNMAVLYWLSTCQFHGKGFYATYTPLKYLVAKKMSG